MCLMIEVVAPTISRERAGSVTKAASERGGVPRLANNTEYVVR